MRRDRLLALGLILTSLLGRLEWGSDRQMFLFEGEWDVLQKLWLDPVSVAHPFVLLPLAGQGLLLVSLFRKQPGQWLTLVGMGCLGLLLGFMALIGILGFRWRIVLSTLPFLIVAVLTMRHHRRAWASRMMRRNRARR